MRDEELADRAAEVKLSEPELLADGYRAYRRYRLELRGVTAEAVRQERDVLAGGKVAAVLPIDLAREEVVLIRQFRLPAHLATGRGDMIEIVAGRVDPGETPAQAARRECMEEIGTAPLAMAEMFSYLTTPGLTDEQVTLFAARIDAAAVPARTQSGGEHIRTLRLPLTTALAALDGHGMRNGPALMALQWLALNRHRLKDLIGG